MKPATTQDKTLKIEGELEVMLKAKALGVSMPMFLVVGIVDYLTINKGDIAWMGEINAMYETQFKFGWSYSAIGSQLRKAVKKGYLVATKDGRYVGYSITKKGVALMSGRS